MRVLLPLAFCAMTSLATITSGGCSGAEEQDVLAESSSSGGSGSLASGTSSGSTSSSSSSGSTTSSSGTSSTDSGTRDPGQACPKESEPNDAPDEATLLSTSICGVLSPSSETDYLTFELSPATRSMHLTFEGEIEMRVYVGGRSPSTLSPDKSDDVPVVIGEPYVIEVRSHGGNGDKVTYKVNLIRT